MESADSTKCLRLSGSAFDHSHVTWVPLPVVDSSDSQDLLGIPEIELANLVRAHDQRHKNKKLDDFVNAQVKTYRDSIRNEQDLERSVNELHTAMEQIDRNVKEFQASYESEKDIEVQEKLAKTNKAKLEDLANKRQGDAPAPAPAPAMPVVPAKKKVKPRLFQEGQFMHTSMKACGMGPIADRLDMIDATLGLSQSNFFSTLESYFKLGKYTKHFKVASAASKETKVDRSLGFVKAGALQSSAAQSNEIIQMLIFLEPIYDQTMRACRAIPLVLDHVSETCGDNIIGRSAHRMSVTLSKGKDMASAKNAAKLLTKGDGNAKGNAIGGKLDTLMESKSLPDFWMRLGQVTFGATGRKTAKFLNDVRSVKDLPQAYSVAKLSAGAKSDMEFFRMTVRSTVRVGRLFGTAGMLVQNRRAADEDEDVHFRKVQKVQRVQGAGNQQIVATPNDVLLRTFSSPAAVKILSDSQNLRRAVLTGKMKTRNEAVLYYRRETVRYRRTKLQQKTWSNVGRSIKRSFRRNRSESSSDTSENGEVVHVQIVRPHQNSEKSVRVAQSKRWDVAIDSKPSYRSCRHVMIQTSLQLDKDSKCVIVGSSTVDEDYQKLGQDAEIEIIKASKIERQTLSGKRQIHDACVETEEIHINLEDKCVGTDFPQEVFKKQRSQAKLDMRVIAKVVKGAKRGK